MTLPITLDGLRQFAVARNFRKPTTLKRAIQALGFVQADPIRSPARAQDLILRQRVRDYHAGDLERRYPSLEIDEDVFINYGFVSRSLQALMHPRAATESGPAPNRNRGTEAKIRLLLDFVRERNEVHPREVEEHFSHGTVPNYWGGSSNASTQLLEEMHYRGLLRVARRARGIRVYAVRPYEQSNPPGRGGSTSGPETSDQSLREMRIDALVEIVVRLYAPLPSASLSYYVRRLRYAVPQWRSELASALQRAKHRLAHARVAGSEWYWPRSENTLLRSAATRQDSPDRDHTVRLLAPFDPLVHDRARFELLWGWAYRFEAYTPPAKRKLGYYALPLLWHDRVIGWANLTAKDGALKCEFGYAGPQPRDRTFKSELAAELDRMRTFAKLEL